MVTIKTTLALSSVVAATIISTGSVVSLAEGLHGGTLSSASPAYILPASTDLYVELNREGAEGTALATLSNVYAAHTGTGAALARVRAALGPAGRQVVDTLLNGFSGHVAMGVFVPSIAQGMSPHIAVVAQLKNNAVANGGNPLQGLATFTPATTYRGVQTYTVVLGLSGTTSASLHKTASVGAGEMVRRTFASINPRRRNSYSPRATSQGGAVYGAVVRGDGVLTDDAATLHAVIDAATANAPVLANDADFVNTTAEVQPDRALTVYTSRHLAKTLYGTLKSAAAQSGAANAGSSARALNVLFPYLQRPYALGVAATVAGITIDTSSIPAQRITLTPNGAASAVSNKAIVYASANGLAGMLQQAVALSPGLLAQIKSQTGIDIVRDVYPLISGEVALDVNDETSPAVQLLVRNAKGLPGAIDIVLQVQSPAAAQAAITRIVTALQTHGAGLGVGFAQTTLPDGSMGYTIPGLAGVGYTFHGSYLIISTSLNSDVQGYKTPLSMDPTYTGTLGHVDGTGSPAAVQYVNIARLLSLVDKYVTYADTLGNGSNGMGALSSSWQQVEPLLTPFNSAATIARQVGAGEEQISSFVSIK